MVSLRRCSEIGSTEYYMAGYLGFPLYAALTLRQEYKKSVQLSLAVNALIV